MRRSIINYVGTERISLPRSSSSCHFRLGVIQQTNQVGTDSDLRYISQAKNLHREIAKAQIQAIQDNADTIERTDRIYKPSYTIEFDRVGEVLLYSCEPLTHSQVYLKYPYVFYESLI